MLDSLDLMTALRMELCHAIDKRDAITADVTSLNAQIAELEARFSAVGKGMALLTQPKAPGRTWPPEHVRHPL